MLTIFTPAYNRAHLLPRLYQSLLRQTVQDFVWLVIDDGSADDTAALIRGFQQETRIRIEYIYQENQGMHGAHNTAYANIKTELNTCIDSDDFMPDNAVELILNKWAGTDRQKYAGIAGLDADMHGNIIGTPFQKDFTTLQDFYENGGKGDKKLVYRTDVVQKYPPYPLFAGEKYVGLSYKYLLIDQDYELATLNEILVLVDYQPSGSSMNMFRQYYRNPKGFAFLRKENMKYAGKLSLKYRNAIHYISSSLLTKNANFLQESPRKLLTLLAIPPGLLLYAFIRWKNRKENASREL